MGCLTLTMEKLSSISGNPIIESIQKTLLVLLFPGIIGAMAIIGNVHAWYLWAAAGINGFIYFMGAWLACRLIIRSKR
jgi:hypothetical protein